MGGGNLGEVIILTLLTELLDTNKAYMKPSSHLSMLNMWPQTSVNFRARPPINASGYESCDYPVIGDGLWAPACAVRATYMVDEMSIMRVRRPIED